MAHIVVGIGTPKSPQVSLPADHWLAHGDADRIGLEEAFDQFAATHGAELKPRLSLDKLEEQYQRCQRHIAGLGQSLATAAPDVLVIFGDEDTDLSVDQNLAPISIYTGEAIIVEPLKAWSGPEYNRPAMWAWYGQARQSYPVATDLARHLLEQLTRLDLDIACSRGQTAGVSFNSSFSFVLRRVVGDAGPLPIVPVTLNAQFQSNQPSARRCFDLGRAVRSIVEQWPSEARVGIVAAGGLSHRIIDETFDRHVLDSIRARDADAFRNLELEGVTSGTGEVRCWIAAAGALEGLTVSSSKYEPCYRSVGGTGCGMAFVSWT